ncbi:DUF3732 domain-containing protein [Pantoea sp. Tr-811]|uniref:DUF3732 domain-containing protein n=1 Tax=Pantoea sp. Tr-811 TaxID=2608361 RepID=UPI00141EC307|nr:DUF3732 domain-containing protein [Pantoea sp. Tr-811]NIF29470.1 DUF3732 domain-containing protein [Pantoea sp. Tr-811]
MKFTINAVILWPLDAKNEIQYIPFEEDKINIIHGLSGTGKSSIVHIIDYALGSSKCQIPIGIIRDSVDWFGLKITFKSESWILARRTPGKAQSSGEFHLSSFNGSIPNIIVRNMNRDDFKDSFNALVRMSDLPHSDEEKPRPFDRRSSYRDMAAFNFLPQHIVANPNTLFFKTDSYKHKERLTRAMPYALGIVDANYVMNERRKDEAEKELDSINKQIATIEKSKKAWSHEVNRLISGCIETGLLPSMISDDFEIRVGLLQSVVDAYNERRLEDTLTEPNRLHSNNEYRAALAAEMAQNEIVEHLASEVSGYEDLSADGHKFNQAIEMERSHAISLDWLRKTVAQNNECIACGSTTAALPLVIENLENRVNQVTRISDVLRENPVIDNTLSSLKRNLAKQQKELQRLRSIKNEILNRDQKLKNSINQIYFLAGSIASLLKRLGKTEADESLSLQAEDLEKKIRNYERAMKASNRSTREQQVDYAISELIGDYSEGLEAPEGSTIFLDRKDLTLRFDGKDGERDYLWEVGSGANWMGYHLAAFLAIHEFLAQPLNQHLPPFGFIVIDQPSQVYFPSSHSGSNDLDGDFADINQKRPADVIATQRIFQTLSEGLKRSNFNVQIIVLEHAGEEIWKSVDHTHSVASWYKKGDGLIPESWQH